MKTQGNSVSDVNSEVTTCELEDIEYLENITQYWTVNEEGYPETFIDSTLDGDFAEFQCTNCNESFDSWNEVKEHINEL